MKPVRNLLLTAAIILTGCPCLDYKVEPEPTPEDVRLCAPAHYPNYCLEALGYKRVDQCFK